MKQRIRRVDWDDELRKTEYIRRRGLFLSVLCLGVAVAFIFGATRFSGGSVGFDRKILLIACLVAAALVMRTVFARRERLRRQRLEMEEELALRKLMELREKSVFK